ncbi:MAG TPA: ribosome biogenesis GTP-binding protein YihA/YsxC, partial [Gammaproteobacteria bacterium]|nr:ribosome biogenesis GTP-binding protein YihA/YsxC [Gammaproteobacteria bacterium]
ILGSGKLARVSKTPGRTQLINFFDLGGQRRCVDLPGYGFARVRADVRETWERMMSGYFRTRRSLCGLMLTVDARRGIGELDEAMLLWCAELGVPVYVLATKVDKLSRNKAAQAALAMQADAGDRAVAVCRFSAHDGRGVAAAREQLLSWVDTGVSAVPAQ